MQFKSWLLTEEENIVVQNDGSVIIHDPQIVPISVWSKIYNYLKHKGYALRSVQDTKERLSRHQQFIGDHAEAIKKAIVPRPPRTEEQKILTKAKRFFGTTTEFYFAGYILPDGSMLDFSGARHGNRYPRQREQDHREIGYVTGTGGTDGMLAFCRQTGAIRVGFVRSGTAFINIYRKPTQQQINTLSRGFTKIDEVSMELSSDGNRSFSEVYGIRNLKKLFIDIQTFYRGEMPEQILRGRERFR